MTAPTQIGQGSNLPSGTGFGLASPTLAGQTIAVIAGTPALGATISAVSDSQNGAYTLGKQSPQSSGRPAVAVFYKTAALALSTSDIITVTTSAGSYYASALALEASAAFDAAAATSATARQNLPLVLPAAAQATELVLGAIQLDGASGTWSEDPAFTPNTNPSGTQLHSAYNIVSTAPGAAAQWLSASFANISSLDTGRLGYIVAWGGAEFGYAYTYALDGTQPAGVTIDSDIGILSVASALAVGSYSFHVIASNRESGAAASLPFTLTVVQGVVQNWVAGQVLHKTYDPHNSAVYGSPSGSDWTNVLLAIQTAIIQDQGTTGDDGLRATIPFHRGAIYQYTNNHWLTGIQYYDVVATGSGAKPVLQCTNTGPATYDKGPLNVGWSGAMHADLNAKSKSCLIQNAAAGDRSVTLITPGQASRIVAGRWHVIVGLTTQIDGEPPNCMINDYVKVLSVNAGTGVVTLDRPLKYRYSSTWYENISDVISFGRGWLVPWDSGGSGGATPSDPRLTLRGRWNGLEFRANPSTGDEITYVEGHIQLDFDTCTVTNPQVSMNKHVAYHSCTTSGGGEPDKLSETIFFNNTTTDILGGATGFLYWLSRGGQHGCLQISPRQFRALGTTFDPGPDTGLQIPISFSFNGPLWYYDIETSTFKPNPTNLTLGWTYGGHPGSSKNAALVIGTDAAWSGNQLRIPTSFAQFEAWMTTAYEGLIVSVAGTAPVGTSWGYVNNVTSPGDGTALWLDITWVAGAKPTSGNLYPVGVFRRLKFTGNSFVAPMAWADPQFASEQASPNALWDFPAGYPVAAPAGAPGYGPSWATAGNAAALLVSFTSTGAGTTWTAQATLAGAGALGSTTILRGAASAVVAGAATLAAPGRLVASAVAVLAGAGLLAAGAAETASAAAVLAGSGLVAGNALVLLKGTQFADPLTLQGAGVLACDAHLLLFATGPLLILGAVQFTPDPGTPVSPGSFFASIYESRSAIFSDVHWVSVPNLTIFSWSPHWPTPATYSARIVRLALNPSQLAVAPLLGAGTLAAQGAVVRASGGGQGGQGFIVCPANIIAAAGAAPAGQGGLACDGVRLAFNPVFASAALAGSGAMSATPAGICLARATLAGAGTLLAAPVMAAATSAQARGAGAIAADAAAIHVVPVQRLAGQGTLAADMDKINAPSAQLDGAGTLSCDPLVFQGTVLYINGEGFINAIAQVQALAAAACGGGSALVAASMPLRTAAALLVGRGTVGAGAATRGATLAQLNGLGTAAGPAFVYASARAALLAFGDLGAAGIRQPAASAALAGFGNLFLLAQPLVQRAASAGLGGAGRLIGNAQGMLAARAVLQGQGGLAGIGLVGQTFFATAALAGQSGLACDASHAAPGAAALAGNGAVIAATIRTTVAAAALLGQGALQSGAIVRRQASATLAGQGTVTASINWLRAGIEELAGEGTLSATARVIAAGAAILPGEGFVSARISLFISATLAGEGSLTAKAEHASQLALSLAGEGFFASDAQSGFIVYHATATPADGALVTVAGADYPVAA